MAITNINNFLKPLSRDNPNMRDYDHASRTFRANSYALHPRLSNLYLCVFNFAPEIASNFSNADKIELPLLVKSVDLPAYTFDVSDHNQYNKRVYAQQKIEYGDSRITFHDDASELVLRMWYNYMTHYYLDSTYRQQDYSVRDRYGPRLNNQFGYANGNERFFNSVQIYTIFDGKFSEYTLVNPIISAFQHGTHTAGEYTPMEHQATIKFEAVLYNSGVVDDVNPKTFVNSLHYDTTPSPLGNIRPDTSTGPGPFGGLFDQGSVFRQIGNTIDKLDQLVPGASGQIMDKINTTLGTTSLYNEVTPMISAAIGIKAGEDPISVIENTLGQSDNPNLIASQNISSNGGAIGNNTYATTQIDTSINYGGTFVKPVVNSSAANARKLSDIYLSRNDPSPVTNNSSIDIKTDELANQITSLTNEVNNSTTLTDEQRSHKSATITRYETRYTDYKGKDMWQVYKRQTGLADAQIVNPRDIDQDLTVTTIEDQPDF